MRLASLSLTILTIAALSGTAWGHGYSLVAGVDGLGNPTSVTAISEAAKWDQTATPLVGPSDVFLDRFAAAATVDGTGTWYGANGGAPATSGPWPAFSSATYTILSPLYFSDGTGGAQLATTGTRLEVYNRFPGDPAHSGAEAGTVILSATTSTIPGFGISLLDGHELGKRLYIAPGSTQTFGEYGFAFSVTVNFPGGESFTTPRLVEVFALRDPSLPGGSFLTASQSQQAAATQAIYNAVPEPSAFALAGIAVATAGFVMRRRRA